MKRDAAPLPVLERMPAGLTACGPARAAALRTVYGEDFSLMVRAPRRLHLTIGGRLYLRH